MALHLIRTTQEADFVHASDAAVTPSDQAGPADGWLPAAGQSDECTRFRIRPLSSAEMAEALAMFAPADATAEANRAGQAAWAKRVCDLGWRALDGTPPPMDLAAGWQARVADLIWQVTATGPFGERRSL